MFESILGVDISNETDGLERTNFKETKIPNILLSHLQFDYKSLKKKSIIINVKGVKDLKSMTFDFYYNKSKEIYIQANSTNSSIEFPCSYSISLVDLKRNLDNKFDKIEIETDDIIIEFQIGAFYNLILKDFTNDLVTYVNGTQRYEGKYSKGRRHGKGTIFFLDGTKFEGNFKNGIPYKLGTLVYTNGTKLEANFDKNFNVIGKGTLYSSKGNNHILEDGYRGNWIICGCPFSGKKTLYRHLKILFSSMSKFSSEYKDYSLIRLSNFLEVFQYFAKEFLLKILEEKRDHTLIEELKFLSQKSQLSKLFEEQTYFMNSVYPIILKMLKEKEFKELFINKIMECPHRDLAFRIINDLNNIGNFNLTKEEIIRVHLKYSDCNPSVLDKEEMFERIEILENKEKNVYKSEKRIKYVYLVNLLEFLKFDKKSRVYTDFDELMKIESKCILVFSKKDLFENLFSRYFKDFETLFPNECKDLEITKEDHEKALKIISGSFVNRTEKRLEIYFMNLLYSNDVKKLFFLKQDFSTKNEKDFIENEKIFIKDLLDIKRDWKIPTNLLKTKLVEKMKEFEKTLKFKWKDSIEKDKIQEYKKGKLIGVDYGRTFVCSKREEIVVLKEIYYQDLNQRKSSIQEFSCGKDFNHPNILKYNDIFTSIDSNGVENIYIDSEFYPLGNLRKFTKENEIDETIIMDFCIQILSGLHYLHENKFIHRDLKPDHILLKFNNDKTEFILSISDFGSLSKEQSENKTTTGKDQYLAPEIKNSEKYSYPADMFSFGGLLYFLLFKKQKTFYLELVKMDKNFEKMIIEEFNEVYFQRKDLFIETLLKCLSKDPKQRPTSKDLLEKFKTQI